MSEAVDLNTKTIDVESLAARALKDNEFLSQLLKGVASSNKNTTIRYNSLRTLKLISEKHPDTLYAEWDYFAELLNSGNSSSEYIAVEILANLVAVDRENKFDKIFEKYFELLEKANVPTAAHAAINAGKIVKAKPKVQNRITGRLLAIDETHHSQERKDLIKGYAIEAFDTYFDQSEDKQKILKFAREQLKSKSPRTREKAAEFLAKWNN